MVLMSYRAKGVQAVVPVCCWWHQAWEIVFEMKEFPIHCCGLTFSIGSLSLCFNLLSHSQKVLVCISSKSIVTLLISKENSNFVSGNLSPYLVAWHRVINSQMRISLEPLSSCSFSFSKGYQWAQTCDVELSNSCNLGWCLVHFQAGK